MVREHGSFKIQYFALSILLVSLVPVVIGYKVDIWVGVFPNALEDIVFFEPDSDTVERHNY
jgi:hypothetical protein